MSAFGRLLPIALPESGHFGGQVHFAEGASLAAEDLAAVQQLRPRACCSPARVIWTEPTRYCARLSFVLERLEQLANDQLSIASPGPQPDGRTER
jgi:hypothetical protein